MWLELKIYHPRISTFPSFRNICSL